MFLSCVFFLLFSAGFAQSSKEILAHAVKSTDIISTEIKKDKQSHSRIVTQYDSQGNEIEKIKYSPDSVVVRREQMKYNAANQIIEHKKMNAKGEVKSITVFEYDSNNNCITEKTVSGKDNKLLGTVEMKYDANNHKIEEVKYDATRKVIKKIMYEYDSKGMMTMKKAMNGAGELMQSKIIKYQY